MHVHISIVKKFNCSHSIILLFFPYTDMIFSNRKVLSFYAEISRWKLIGGHSNHFYYSLGLIGVYLYSLTVENSNFYVGSKLRQYIAIKRLHGKNRQANQGKRSALLSFHCVYLLWYSAYQWSKITVTYKGEELFNVI